MGAAAQSCQFGGDRRRAGVRRRGGGARVAASKQRRRGQGAARAGAVMLMAPAAACYGRSGDSWVLTAPGRRGGAAGRRRWGGAAGKTLVRHSLPLRSPQCTDPSRSTPASRRPHCHWTLDTTDHSPHSIRAHTDTLLTGTALSRDHKLHTAHTHHTPSTAHRDHFF